MTSSSRRLLAGAILVFLVASLAAGACAVWHMREEGSRVGGVSLPFGQFDELKGAVKMVRCAVEGIPCVARH